MSEKSVVIRGRTEDIERFSEREEAIERAEARSTIEVVEGRKILKIRWTTGKTAASRLFGRYGREGRPDFFRLIFGAIAGSLREQFGDKGTEEFNRLRESKTFKDSISKIFDEMKTWFFNEIVPKYKIEPGDVFIITTEIEIDLETGEIKWNKEKSEVIYWIRSDRVIEKCRELGIQPEVKVTEVKSEEIEQLRKRIEELTNELEEWKKRYEETKNELEEWRKKYEELKNEKDRIENEKDRLKIELDTIRTELEKVKKESEELKSKLESLKKLLSA